MHSHGSANVSVYGDIDWVFLCRSSATSGTAISQQQPLSKGIGTAISQTEFFGVYVDLAIC
jgi:hypothetical protein